MEFSNDDLLQLVECIESTQNEVKRKMIVSDACNAVPKSHRASFGKKFCARAISLSQKSIADVRRELDRTKNSGKRLTSDHSYRVRSSTVTSHLPADRRHL
jgi:hypothetical protein